MYSTSDAVQPPVVVPVVVPVVEVPVVPVVVPPVVPVLVPVVVPVVPPVVVPVVPVVDVPVVVPPVVPVVDEVVAPVVVPPAVELVLPVVDVAPPVPTVITVRLKDCSTIAASASARHRSVTDPGSAKVLTPVIVWLAEPPPHTVSAASNGRLPTSTPQDASSPNDVSLCRRALAKIAYLPAARSKRAMVCQAG